MAKKKVQTLKEKLLAVIHEENSVYVEKWESAWKKYKTIEDKLPYRLFLYNKYTKKFFFYFYPGEWVQIS